MQRTRSWRTRQLLTCRCVSAGYLLRSMQNTQGLADAQSWKWCRDDVAAGRRQFAHHEAITQSLVKPPPPPAWIMQPPRLADTAERDYFTLEADHYAKTTEPRSILMSSADRVAHIDGQLIAIIVSNTHALQRTKCLSNRNEQSIYECLLGFCF